MYNELLNDDYEVEVYNNKGKEIDFRAYKNNKVCYIQVTCSLADEKTYDREFTAFEGLSIKDRRIISNMKRIFLPVRSSISVSRCF